jgi:DNA-binding LacI/PurR family transcriptional regulator
MAQTSTRTAKKKLIERDPGAHQRVVRHILESYHPGDHVPGPAELSAQLRVSAYAAARALNELSSRGLLVREQGRGSFLTATSAAIAHAGNGAAILQSHPAPRRIAYVAGDLNHSGLSLGLLAVFNREMAGTGLQLAIRSTGQDSALELAELRNLPADGFAGAILNVAETPENLAQLRDLRRRNFPCVLVDHERSDDDHGAQVSMDHRAVARQAAEKLAAAGHRHIAFIGHTERAAASFEGLAKMADGYREGLEAAGIALRPDYVKSSPEISGHHAPTREEIPFMTYIPMNQLLRLNEPPTAIVTLNGHFALGAMLAARDAGLRVPGDISFAGIADVIPDARSHGLPYHLSGSKISVDELGRAALAMLRRLMTEGCSPIGGCRTLLPPIWQDGDTILEKL